MHCVLCLLQFSGLGGCCALGKAHEVSSPLGAVAQVSLLFPPSVLFPLGRHSRGSRVENVNGLVLPQLITPAMRPALELTCPLFNQ